MTADKKTDLPWTEDEHGTMKLMIGPLRAIVAHYTDGDYAWVIDGTGGGERGFGGRLLWSRPMSRRSAKAEAEAKLLEYYEALRDLFAASPMLEWWLDEESYDSDPGYCARLGKWMLHASIHGWSLSNAHAALPLADGAELGVEENQRAAEEALRSMGVAFRRPDGCGSLR